MGERPSESQMANRILAKGIIETPIAEFSLPFDTPFTLCLVNKNDNYKSIEIVNCRLMAEDPNKPLTGCPFNVGGWTSPLVEVLEVNQYLIDNYIVFWGTGQFIPGEE